MAHTSNFYGLTSRCKVPTSRPHLSCDPEGRAGSSVADGLRIATKADTGRLCSTNLHRLVTKPGIKFFLRCQCCRPMACRLPLKKKNELRRARTPSRCRGSAAGLRGCRPRRLCWPWSSQVWAAVRHNKSRTCTLGARPQCRVLIENSDTLLRRHEFRT